jgi:hypothetical protein
MITLSTSVGCVAVAIDDWNPPGDPGTYDSHQEMIYDIR